ncbi:hypothetical protein SHJJP8921_000594 [Staphylococcus lugdunensis]|nr:hypothetical protein [Staphylococcus lugdunensis]MCH8646349.1 hypothetical protein [Staphylococcus lugdunensis]
MGPQQRGFQKESQQTTRVGVAKTVLLASEPTIRSIVNKEGSGTTNS